jgi:truncated hemoglobin YjbI
MEPFRTTRGGGVRAALAPAEASLLRSLVGQVITLVAPDGPPRAPTDDPLDWNALEAELDHPQLSDDPVLARLLPDGYRDDPEAANEFRKYTESSLRGVKHQAAQDMLDTLPEAGGKFQLTQDQAQAWLKALNDVRLALGVRLGVTEEFEEQWGRLAADDPQWAAYEVYAWLGAVQESLVQALA